MNDPYVKTLVMDITPDFEKDAALAEAIAKDLPDLSASALDNGTDTPNDELTFTPKYSFLT